MVGDEFFNVFVFYEFMYGVYLLFYLFSDMKFGEIKIIKFKNGVCVVFENFLGLMLIVGIYIDSGLIYELLSVNGVLYLLERMVFKSISNWFYFCLVCEVEVIGGNIMVNVF